MPVERVGGAFCAPSKDLFYEPACQVSSLAVAASDRQDTPPVSAHSPFNQQGVCARTGCQSDSVVKRSVTSRLTPARSLILLFALVCGSQRAGAQ
jgi:hypothetical protein